MTRRGFLRLVFPVAAAGSASLDARADADAMVRLPPSVTRALPLPAVMYAITVDGVRYGIPLYELV